MRKSKTYGMSRESFFTRRAVAKSRPLREEAPTFSAIWSQRNGNPALRRLLGLARSIVPALATAGIEAIPTTLRPIPGDGLTCAGPMPQVAGYCVGREIRVRDAD
jgi:hypothetical protein